MPLSIWNLVTFLLLGGDTLQKEGSLLSRQQGVRPCHLQALRRGQKADRAA